MKKYTVTLTKNERYFLKGITSKGNYKSQGIINSLILMDCDEGGDKRTRSTNKEISRMLNIGKGKINHIKKRFVKLGIDVALNVLKGNRKIK